MKKTKQRFFNLWKPKRRVRTPEREAFDFFHPTTPAGKAVPADKPDDLREAVDTISGEGVGL